MLDALLVNAAVLATMMLALWVVAVRIGDVSFIDAVWALGMVVLALASWWQLDMPGTRATLILVMTAVWGLRLGTHLLGRWRASGEDPRYARMLGEAKAAGKFRRAALTLVFAPQALLLFLVCLPAQLTAALFSLIGPLFLTFTLTRWSGKPLLERAGQDAAGLCRLCAAHVRLYSVAAETNLIAARLAE